MKFLRNALAKLRFAIFFLLVPATALAQITIVPDSSNSSGKLINPINESTINGFIKALLVGVLKIGIPIVALAIIYCGFLFVAARGNSEKLTKAKSALLWTIIGAAILLGAWALSELIANTVLSL